MSVLSKGVDFTTGDQVTAANLDALVDNATFTSDAVDNSTTQLSGGAIIVKDGGITSSKLASTIDGKTYTNVDIQSGDAVLEIVQVDSLRPQYETGYATSGTVDLVFGGKSRAVIVMTGNITFTSSGLARGLELHVIIFNNSGSTYTLAYPGWATASSQTFPTSLGPSQRMALHLYCTGSSGNADVFASYD